MATTQVAKNMPNKLRDGENEHQRPIGYTGNRSGPTHRPRTEAYEYNSMSDNVPPAGEYLRAPVCCSECEEFWKALILEIDEKHTSRVPAGKASLVMAKGASGSVLQIKSTKHVGKERRFFSGLGCMNSTVREDAFHSLVGSKFHACQPRASQISSNTTSIKSNYRGHDYPQRKLNVTTVRSNHVAPAYSTPSYAEPFVNQPGLSSVSRRFELQGSLHRTAIGYNAYGAASKHDVISTPRRHGHNLYTDRPRSALYPERPESSASFTQTRSNQFSSMSSGANQAQVRGDPHRSPHPDATLGVHDLKPIRTHIDGGRRPEGNYSHLSTPRRYAPINNENLPGSRGAHYPTYADSSQLKPFPPRFFEKANSRAQPREFLSHPSTPRMYTPMSQTPRASPLPENRVQDSLHYNSPPITPRTPGSRGRWETQSYREHHKGIPPGGNPRLSPSPKHQEDYSNSSPSRHQSSQAQNPNPNSGHSRNDILSPSPQHHNNYSLDGASRKHPSSQDDIPNSAPSPQHRTIYGLDRASRKHPSSQEDSPTLAPSPRQSSNPNPSSDHTTNDIALERKLSRTSTIESGYTSLSIPRSASSSELDSLPPSPRSRLAGDRVFHTKSHRPQDLMRNGVNNLSRTSTSTSSLMEPIVLFTGHDCRSETDENSDDDDVVVTNPNYFKHIIANPNYIKRIIKPQPPIATDRASQGVEDC